VFKLYCALLVVMIHCSEVYEGHPVAMGIVQCLSSQAVPFFMVVSGFFIGNKLFLNNNTSSIWKSVKSWLLLYFAWAVLWLPYLSITYIDKYPDASTGYVALMLVRRILFAGQGVYWYLLVLAETAIILSIFIKFKKLTWFYVIGALGLILGLLFDANVTTLGLGKLNSIVYTIFSWSNNVFMKGIPYVAIGLLFSKYYGKIKIKNWLLIAIYFTVTIGMIFLYCIGMNRWLCFYLIQAVCLFMIAIQFTHERFRQSTVVMCRNLSTAIYFLHTIFIYGVIDPALGIDSPVLLKFCCAVLGSCIIYFVVNQSQIRPFKWLLNVK
ncbi:MAG: acyltransferase, partial [Eubacteriales bacterium]|nr:acyltransferase [Eubacteriales bacterium]